MAMELELVFLNVNVVFTFPLDMLMAPKSNELPDAENEPAVEIALPLSGAPGAGFAIQMMPRSTAIAIPNHIRKFLFIIN